MGLRSVTLDDGHSSLSSLLAECGHAKTILEVDDNLVAGSDGGLAISVDQVLCDHTVRRRDMFYEEGRRVWDGCVFWQVM
ncbi:MAG: hypothetical protein SXU28_00230 [Pseudomonadota bacterium]|nr:hypothetical protein [Pseudomonadota bacterium]